MSAGFDGAKNLFVGGVQAFEAGRYAEAEKKFEASLALLPGRVSTLSNLGAARIKLSRPGEALGVLDQALAAEPGNTDARCHRGVALADLGRHVEALACFEQVLQAAAPPALAWYCRGISLAALRRPADALAALDRFLALQPEHAEAWFRHGQTLQALDRHEQALASYDKALAIDPGIAPAWTNRGSVLKDMQRPDEAALAFEQAIAHGGNAELNGYFLASLRGRAAPASAPRGYVQGLFDDYAEAFDEHLVGVLRYQAPAILIDNLRRMGNRRFRHALDLGCGTGLCGPLVEPIADRIDGVDLSPKMIERAQRLAVYGRLVQDDIVDYLRTTDQHHDLVLAADVFTYIGDLEPVFGGVRRVLERGGMFCFCAELPETDSDFELKPSMRYGQSERYIRELAQRHAFDVLTILRHPIREDQQRPIAGLYVFLTWNQGDGRNLLL